VSIENMSESQTEVAVKNPALPPQANRRIAFKWSWLWGGLVVLALVIYPLVNSADTYGINLLTQILIAAIFALSYDLIFGYTGLLSFGQASYYGLGAFGAGLLVSRFEISNFWLSLLVAIAIASVGALILGFFSIRTSGVYFMMLTLALAQMLFSIAFKWEFTGSSDGVPFTRPEFSLFGVSLKELTPFYFFVVACFILCFIGLTVVIRSPFGQVLKGIRDNEERMTAVGYQTRNFKLVAFVLAGAIAGLAGGLNALFTGFVGANSLNWINSGAVLVMVLLGGKGTLVGSVVGAFFVIYIQSLIQGSTIPIGNYTLADRWLTVLGLIFMIFVLFAPNGIVGLGKSMVRRVKEWQQKR
jgi:branched-chain amino acid transport system permease protein